MIAIILNGTSSAGKTSIARSMLSQSGEPMFHVAPDMYNEMVDWSSVPEELEEECDDIIMANFIRSLPVLASNRFPIIIDIVLDGYELADCVEALKDRRIILVGVHCSLEIAEARERERGDREIGLAKEQFDPVHRGKAYDLELNTSSMTPSHCAEIILKYIKELTANNLPQSTETSSAD
ncbi:MAG: chloramphenicol phosphotransferase [Verrucomicrobiota bacterium]